MSEILPDNKDSDRLIRLTQRWITLQDEKEKLLKKGIQKTIDVYFDHYDSEFWIDRFGENLEQIFALDKAIAEAYQEMVILFHRLKLNKS